MASRARATLTADARPIDDLGDMATSLLITQCLQNDFVKPIDRFDPIPNQLHVGHAEALRLLGATPAEGPVERTMQWAYAQSDELVRVIHIRDWHDPSEPDQASHLAQFGEHCIRDSEGAAFAFGEPDRHGKDIGLVDSVTLNDFEGTTLASLLSPYAAAPRRVGLVGVWTEAKVLFLAYELRTRYPSFELGVCSALTASSSRQHHFQALDQLARIVGVRVIDSVGEFIDWLGGGRASDAPLPGLGEGFPELEAGGATIDPADARLIRFLFRDCRRVSLKLMGGGFSGNLVAGTTSIDVHGHEQVPHVVKIGPRSTMARERTSFERIQNVMGNNAPQISDFVDQGERGAIKYRYASMGGTFSTTFQKEYQRGLALDEVRRIVDTVFGEQLMRLYKAATLESGDLLTHYYFAPERAPGVQRAVEAIMAAPVGDELELVPGVALRNPARFYDVTLAKLPARPQDRFHHAYVHGDLNGQNIVLDGHRNVWLIDFFHTRRAHVLMDLVKLENDLLYIFTPIRDEAELREGMRLTDALLELDDLWATPDERSPSPLPQMQRAWATLRMLRAYHPRLVQSDRSPLQLLVAQLRYAGHTLSFDEPSPLQLRWALYTAARCITKIEALLAGSTRLRIDMLAGPQVGTARVGLTILPGRRDWRRDLADDLDVMRREGIDAVVCLVPLDELERYGVPELLDAYRSAGLELLHLPLLDQQGAGREVLRDAAQWIETRAAAGRKLAIHCVGGLGRSGMVAAAWLQQRGASVDEALAAVRTARGPRAVETPAQEQSLRGLT